MIMKLNLRESKLNRDVKILEIEGRIDAYTHVNIQEELNVLLNIGSNKIVCNFANVDYIGPAGLKTFLNCIKKAREIGGDIKLAGLQPSVKRIFEFSGFSKVCIFYDDENRASLDFAAIKSKPKAKSLSENDMYGQTLQISPGVKKWEEEDLRAQTIIGNVPRNAPDMDLYGATIQVDSSQIAKAIQKEENVDLYGQTIEMSSSPLEAKAPDPLATIYEESSDPQGKKEDVQYEFTAEVDKNIINKILELEKKEGKEEARKKSDGTEKVLSFSLNYRIRNKIAEGAIGKIYYGIEESSYGFQKPVALKYIKNQYSSDEQNIGMLVREVRKVSSVTHQNIAQIHKIVALDDYCFIVMEYADGITLSSLLQKIRENNRTFSPQHATLIVYTICSAMAYANRKKDDEGTTLEIVHGEITPDNIILSKDTDIKLVGLGISKISSIWYHQQNNTLKHLAYTAPEVIETGTPTKAGDIFSIGVIFYELLTGRKPFKPEQIAQKKFDMPPRPGHFNEKSTDILDGVVLRCLYADPQKRFAEFQDMALQLEETLYDKGFSMTLVSLQKFLENNKIF